MAEARVIASDIESWLPGVAVDNVVDAVDIREKVVKELKVLSIKVAANFESYQKS